MKIKIIIIVGIITILAVGYNSYILSQVKKMAETNKININNLVASSTQSALITKYFITPDAQNITGFTKEVYNSFQIISEILKNQTPPAPVTPIKK